MYIYTVVYYYMIKVRSTETLKKKYKFLNVLLKDLSFNLSTFTLF